eukprot:symbB.v1.2.042929.t1/scaffold11615.1/size1238/1
MRICRRHSHRAEKLIEFLKHSTYSSHLNGDDCAGKASLAFISLHFVDSLMSVESSDVLFEMFSNRP